ncbi:MAG: tRNA (5-methylaminomethyl-2-thiouridine)(34)-methyltransferase MnmD [Saprospiraceae bacterium]|nr:tRNA (5-methylaminomethyl-2-thiouridine)(34)-methyltransferase MnmD [Saprospiraceae bacterium]
MTKDVVLTEDNSPTYYSRQFNALYHSRHGALTETNHVFIEAGLCKALEVKKTIHLLEVGFGTGLNTWATLKSIPKDTTIHYTALEKFPIDIINLREFKDMLFGKSVEEREFNDIHAASWNESSCIQENFFLHKVEIDFLEFKSNTSFDLIYFDAFAPEVQPELWTQGFFKHLYNMLSQGGILVTYCAKGYVKRNLKAAGFVVESLPGPPGKREMTRAHKL